MTDHSNTPALVAWLRQQLAEDERAVWHWDSDGRARVATMWTGGEPGYTTVATEHGGEWIADGREVTDARHVTVLHDPARVLREVAAKRKLLELHVNQGSETLSVCAVCDAGAQSCGCVGWDEWPCETVKLFALPYEDRPGYQESWRP